MTALFPIPDLSAYDPATREAATDLIERFQALDTGTAELSAVHARKEACRIARDLAQESSELVLPVVPQLVNLLHQELDRSFDGTAAEMVQHNPSVSIQTYAAQVLTACAERSLVQTYAQGTCRIDRFLTALAQTLCHAQSYAARLHSLRGLASICVFVPERLVDCTSTVPMVSAIGSLLPQLDSDADRKRAFRVLATFLFRSPDLHEHVVADVEQTKSATSDPQCMLYTDLLTDRPALGDAPLSMVKRLRMSDSAFVAATDNYSGIRYWRSVEELGVAIALHPGRNESVPEKLVEATNDPEQRNQTLVRRTLGELVYWYHECQSTSTIIESDVQRYLTATGRERRTGVRVLGALTAYTDAPSPTVGTDLCREIRTTSGMSQLRSAEALGTVTGLANSDAATRDALARKFTAAEGRDRRRYARALGEWTAANGDLSTDFVREIADRVASTNKTRRDITARALSVVTVLAADEHIYDRTFIQQVRRLPRNAPISTREAAITLGIMHIASSTVQSVPSQLLNQVQDTDTLDHEIAARAVGEFLLTRPGETDNPLVGLAEVVRRTDGLDRMRAARAFGFAFVTLSREISIAVPDLIARVQSTVPQERAHAAHVLGLVTALPAASLPPALSSLRERVYDPNEDSRWDLARLAGYSVASRPDAFVDLPDGLVAVFRQATGRRRRQTAIALGVLIGIENDQSQAPLESFSEAVRTQSGTDRRHAALAVGTLLVFETDSPSGKLAALFQHARSSQEPTRLEAARAIGELYSFTTKTMAESLDEILSVIRTGASYERHEAAQLLGSIVAVAPGIVDHVSPPLVEKLGSTTHLNREQDRRALGLVAGASDRVDAIIRLLDELEADLSREAIESYGQALKHLLTEVAGQTSVENALLSATSELSDAPEEWLTLSEPARQSVLAGIANILPAHLSRETAATFRTRAQQILSHQESLPTETRLALIRILLALGEQPQIQSRNNVRR